MKHTPGPWHIAEYGTNEDGTPKFYGIVKGNLTIANLGMSTQENAKEKDANAALIAAAPELLRACKYVVKYHREHDSGEGELFGLDFVTTCIAAIAKAEGRE